MNRHPEEIRRRATLTDPATPWVTWYGPTNPEQPFASAASGLARVELSRATFDNWVAKAAGLLADEFDVAEGTPVLVRLRSHWLAPVWVWALWSLGATVVLDSATDAALAIIDDVSDPMAESVVGDVLVSSTHPMGLSHPNDLPAGWVDALADIRQYPDVRNDPIPDDSSILLQRGDVAMTVDEVIEDAAALNPDQDQRILVNAPDLHTTSGLLAACLVAPLVDGSTILINAAEAEAVEQISQQERVQHVLHL